MYLVALSGNRVCPGCRFLNFAFGQAQNLFIPENWTPAGTYCLRPFTGFGVDISSVPQPVPLPYSGCMDYGAIVTTPITIHQCQNVVHPCCSDPIVAMASMFVSLQIRNDGHVDVQANMFIDATSQGFPGVAYAVEQIFASTDASDPVDCRRGVGDNVFNVPCNLEFSNPPSGFHGFGGFFTATGVDRC
jgi:hypothetical protein